MRNWIVNSLLSNLFITAICLLGDLGLKQRAKLEPLHIAIIDNGTHGLVGLLSGQLYFGWERDWLIVCMLMSSAVDIDHFIASRSVKLSVSQAHSSEFNLK